jgi:hypothetical protein
VSSAPDYAQRELDRPCAAALASTPLRATLIDHAGVDPNPARDRSIKLPREEPEDLGIGSDSPA